MLSWRHTGFHVHVGGRIWPEDETALGNLAKYIVHAGFSQERMLYIPAEKSADGSAKVVYQSKDGRTEQTFDALDWLARLVIHIPNRYLTTTRSPARPPPQHVAAEGGRGVIEKPVVFSLTKSKFLSYILYKFPG